MRHVLSLFFLLGIQLALYADDIDDKIAIVLDVSQQFGARRDAARALSQISQQRADARIYTAYVTACFTFPRSSETLFFDFVPAIREPIPSSKELETALCHFFRSDVDYPKGIIWNHTKAYEQASRLINQLLARNDSQTLRDEVLGRMDRKHGTQGELDAMNSLLTLGDRSGALAGRIDRILLSELPNLPATESIVRMQRAVLYRRIFNGSPVLDLSSYGVPLARAYYRWNQPAGSPLSKTHHHPLQDAPFESIVRGFNETTLEALGLQQFIEPNGLRRLAEKGERKLVESLAGTRLSDHEWARVVSLRAELVRKEVFDEASVTRSLAELDLQEPLRQMLVEMAFFPMSEMPKRRCSGIIEQLSPPPS